MKCTLIILSLFFAYNVAGQTISEKLGGVKTDFEFYSNGELYPIVSQHIFPEEKTHTVSSEYNRTLMLGDPSQVYTTNSFILSFASNFDIHKDSLYEQDRKQSYYELKLYDDYDKLIGVYRLVDVEEHPRTKFFPGRKYDFTSGEKFEFPYYIYSIQIDEIPMILLDMTKKIDITYSFETWKQEKNKS
ncbi:hypothetical protein [Chondrinema litorale]|uniref:hypothetical protein n=1 Tax=Chondrinema litorale TaxID=2994555 RepID=UPI002543085B|nr:hypothetical protein [Chondrinema litorale]UZR95698.1 hypothetical protein OQ292_07725 [Chondrinema litorale]